MELARTHDAHGDRPRQQGLLLGDLRGVVTAAEPVDPDDRHDDQPSHAGPLTGLLQIAGGGREELRRRLLIGGGPGGDVDGRVDSGEGLVQPLARDHVHAVGARHRDDVVPARLEDVDDVPADPPGRSRHCDLGALLHLSLLRVDCAFTSETRRGTEM